VSIWLCCCRQFRIRRLYRCDLTELLSKSAPSFCEHIFKTYKCFSSFLKAIKESCSFFRCKVFAFSNKQRFPEAIPGKQLLPGSQSVDSFLEERLRSIVKDAGVAFDKLARTLVISELKVLEIERKGAEGRFEGC
jgi:hypothetical protein